ncbi:MAG: hypothetical protein HKN17_08355 [Rhodothermales bacterium]|nr:hypothetical protein [Rhodothermales bacterium]
MRKRSSSLAAPVLAALLIWSLGLLPGPGRALAQSTDDLLRIYSFQRTLHNHRLHVAQNGARMPMMPVAHLPNASDTVRAWIQSKIPSPPVEPAPPPPSFPLESIRRIRKLEFQAYDDRFARTEWAFLGADGSSRLDTMLTSRIRASMQHHFGDPTRTLVEIGRPDTLRREEVIEFEYWFFLNGDIPFLVVDVNGPWDRGVVVAAEHSYRDELHLIKQAVLDRVLDDPTLKTFADYYYNFDQRRWYVSGYDGARFFDTRIQPPNLNLGRPRPDGPATDF